MSKTTIMMIIGSLLALLIFAGCPVDDDSKGDSSENPEGRKPDFEQEASDNPCGEENPYADENPCGDETSAADENPCGEENPCDEVNPCADENPCGEENPCSEENPCTEDEPEDNDVTTVILETTKGDITLAVHHDWAPIGAAHYIELVEAGFYDGAPWFRVIPGFMCQTGVAADPKVTAKWQKQTIKDEAVIKGNTRGNVSFGKSGAPNSRSTHVFINFKNNSAALDGQGFSAFAEVVDGMDVADAIYATGENPPGLQGMLSQRGAEGFLQQYPEGDFITRAYIKE